MASSSPVPSPRRRPPRAVEIPLLVPDSPRLNSPRRPPTLLSSTMPPPPTSSSSTSSVISPPPSSTSSSTAPPPPPPSSTNVAGMLRVEVMSARNLHAAVLGSLLKWTPNYSNPYVVVTLHRDEFITTTKDKTLNPTWKEMGQLKVPLPTEQELLQTVGIHRSVHGVGLGYPVNDPSSKQKLSSNKLSSGSGSGAGGLDTGDFQACYPQLKVQVYHQSDEGTSGSPSRAQQQNQPQPATPQRRPTDKLIGEVIVPVLPCLLSSTSSSRAWYTLLSDEHPEAGQIQIALHYDVGGLEPLKGDIVRFAGFGGMEYYAKLVNANARLDVIDMFQDQVVVQVKSIEGWLLSFEVHRNLLFVVRRPSMLRDAQSQLQGQIVRVRHSPLVTKAHNVWQSIPAGQRRQLQHLYELVVFSGGAVYTVVNASVHTAMNDGVKAGIKSCVNGSSEAVNQVSLEAVRLFWADESARRPRKSPAQDAVFHLEGGPLAGRGKIVSGFDGGKYDSSSTQLALYDRHGDEEKTADDEYVVEPDEDTVDAEEEGDADGEADSEQDRSNVHSEYDDEEKTNEDDPSGHWLEDCPDQLICPITGCPMIDPVVAADGHSYEREAILQWFATSNKSPMTGAQMPTTQVFPNFTLRKLSEEFQSKMRPRK